MLLLVAIIGNEQFHSPMSVSGPLLRIVLVTLSSKLLSSPSAFIVVA